MLFLFLITSSKFNKILSVSSSSLIIFLFIYCGLSFTKLIDFALNLFLISLCFFALLLSIGDFSFSLLFSKFEKLIFLFTVGKFVNSCEFLRLGLKYINDFLLKFLLKLILLIVFCISFFESLGGIFLNL